ncbi:SDR family NAD(P)-dependent oxidoreductase [Edaphobacter aggregans]|uniref:SDR family NAD(P)-dependent oxidoreductase n=1 Tax=Edaphobacter aggregans TaxID=570835 RepID=UPI000551D573|nr:SDR family NAD(P)-dependent oxidoreductase [Edaphobacter aggregans]
MRQIRTAFGFQSTAEDVVKGIDLCGKRAIVTGASSGIGVETARALAIAGAEVTLAVRNTETGSAIATQIAHAVGNSKIVVKQLDLSNPASVKAFVADWSGAVHILINNAGIMATPQLERTAEGYELQFVTNFLGHFALSVGLHNALASANGARIVSLSSSANLISPVLFDDLHFRFLPYDPFISYGQSKTANVLFAVEATKRWMDDGIFTNALNPGAIPTNLQKHTGGLKTPPERRKTAQQGAATSVLLAVSPLLDGIGGRYFEDCNEAAIVSEKPKDFGGGVAPYALDPDNAARLWRIAQTLVS